MFRAPAAFVRLAVRPALSELGSHARPDKVLLVGAQLLGQGGPVGAHRQQVPEQLRVHVRLAQEGHHEHLLLAQAQARAAVHVAVQVAPVPHLQFTTVQAHSDNSLSTCLRDGARLGLLKP